MPYSEARKQATQRWRAAHRDKYNAYQRQLGCRLRAKKRAAATLAALRDKPDESIERQSIDAITIQSTRDNEIIQETHLPAHGNA